MVERAILLAEDHEVTPRHLIAAGMPADTLPPPAGSPEAAERGRVLAALEACGYNQTYAARQLGVSRNTLIRLLKKHRIKRPRGGGSA